MWFNEIAASKNPGKIELQLFVCNTLDFLRFVLENRKDFGFLWETSPVMYDLAMGTFHDIEDAGRDLDAAIADGLDEDDLKKHGLQGRPLQFKFHVLNAIGNQWEQVKKQFSIREWFKKIIDAIDAILNSLIAVAGGAGGAIKEFKDALRALA